MEAAVAVRFFRRILHYISKALGGLGLLDIEPSGKSKRRQAREFVENRLWKIGIRLLIALLALLIAGGIFFYTLRMISASLSETLLIIWSTYIGISLGSLLIVKIRSSLVTLDPIAVLGIVVCVTGAELFHYPENTFPLARSIPLITEQQISVATSLLPGVTAWDAALIVFGQLAFVIGILVSMLFWSISNRQATV
jgi:hypothetical protein